MSKEIKHGYKKSIVALVLLAIATIVIGVWAAKYNNFHQASEPDIVYSDEERPASVEMSEQINGVEEIENEAGLGEAVFNGETIPTVESVDSGGPVTDIHNTECPEGEECGMGADKAEVLDISSPQAFANATLGRCIEVDNYMGAQCWDLAAAFFLNYTGHTMYTCGTGAAKGTIMEGCWQKNNAGNEFTMIWDPKQIQPGDIAVYSTGVWGHVGMAMGYYNNGYFTLLGENQGGGYCAGGGSATNIINLSTKDFIGAFRPNIYIMPEPEPEPKPEPEPTPTPTPSPISCDRWALKWGDTLSKIMATCEGKVEWGSAMIKYAKSWYSTIVKPGQSVYAGWNSSTGVGLYAGDVIERR